MRNYFKLTTGLLLVFMLVFSCCFAAEPDSDAADDTASSFRYEIDDAASLLTI